MIFRQFQHLLPKSVAWRIKDGTSGWLIGDDNSVGDPGLVIGGNSTGSLLSRFFAGLAQALEPFSAFFDGVFGDAFPNTTRELSAWEGQFGIEPNVDDAVRRQNLNAEWSATGGQSPEYINSIIQAAGFDVWVHEWWASGPPYITRLPKDFTLDPLIGSVQCSAFADQPQCSALPDQPECNRFLANDPHYFVNKNLTNVAPPPIPDDPATWRYFVYFGAETFPDNATVPLSRKSELERLILKLIPAQHWVVTLIDYV